MSEPGRNILPMFCSQGPTRSELPCLLTQDVIDIALDNNVTSMVRQSYLAGIFSTCKVLKCIAGSSQPDMQPS